MIKKKKFDFTGRKEVEAYIDALFDAQEGRWAISELPMHRVDGDEWEMHRLMDRIGGKRHRQQSNLQVVCWFINRWKSASEDVQLRRSVAMMQEGRFSERASRYRT